MKEGDLNEYHGEAILGTFSGKIALEGPIKKGQSSFLVSFRRSTVDLYLRGIYAFQKPEDKFLYHYSDLNVKLNHRVDSKNHLFLSFYRGGDNLSTTGTRTFAGPNNMIRNYSNRYLNDWGNQFFSLRWNRTFSRGIFLNTTFAYSDFNYHMESGDAIKDDGEVSSSNKFKFGVGVKDLVFKSELDIPVSSRFNLKTGVQLVSHDFQPVDWKQRRTQLRGMGRYENANTVKISALESFFYVQSGITAMDHKLSLNPGFRAGNYRLANGKKFLILEPGFNANYQIFDEGRIEVDYSKMTQTVHSLNTSGTSLTPDIWIPVTETMRPATSEQVSLSISKPIEGMDVLIGGYYKEMQNLIEYNRNSGFGMTKGNWEEGVFTGGSGRAFGLELSVDKRFDRFNIEGNYTFSRSLRKFEQINEGRTFSHYFDRPHNINLGSGIRLNAKSKLSVQWVYQSGQPITLGSQTYLALGNVRFSHRDPYLVTTPDLITSGLSSPSFTTLEGVVLIDEINNFRMPSHHRLDIAYAHQKQWKNGWNRTFTASVYNAYNRQNAYYLFLEKENDGFNFYKLTLFPILPSISYRIKF